ncbi:MAG: hypothetical protein RLZZ499_1645 [Cyanobacteriota bacterium]|jgi:hypothetical protein
MSLDWKVSESTVFRLVRKIENILIKSRRFSLPGKKKLLDSSLDEDLILNYLKIVEQNFINSLR